MSDIDMHLAFRSGDHSATMFRAGDLPKLENFFHTLASSPDRFARFADITQLRALGELIIGTCDRNAAPRTTTFHGASIADPRITDRVAPLLTSTSVASNAPPTDQRVVDGPVTGGVDRIYVFRPDAETAAAAAITNNAARPLDAARTRTPSPTSSVGYEIGPITPPPTLRRPVPALHDSVGDATTRLPESPTAIVRRRAAPPRSTLALTQTGHNEDDTTEMEILSEHGEEQDEEDEEDEQDGEDERNDELAAAGTIAGTQQVTQPVVHTTIHSVYHTLRYSQTEDHMRQEEEEMAEEDEVADELLHLSDDESSPSPSPSAQAFHTADAPDVLPVVDDTHRATQGAVSLHAASVNLAGNGSETVVPFNALPAVPSRPLHSEVDHVDLQVLASANADTPLLQSLSAPSSPAQPAAPHTAAPESTLDPYFGVDPSEGINVRPRIVRTNSRTTNSSFVTINDPEESYVPTAAEDAYRGPIYGRRSVPLHRAASTRPLVPQPGLAISDSTSQPPTLQGLPTPSTAHIPGAPHVGRQSPALSERPSSESSPSGSSGQKRSREEDDAEDSVDERSPKRTRLPGLPEEDPYEWFDSLAGWRREVPTAVERVPEGTSLEPVAEPVLGQDEDEEDFEQNSDPELEYSTEQVQQDNEQDTDEDDELEQDTTLSNSLELDLGAPSQPALIGSSNHPAHPPVSLATNTFPAPTPFIAPTPASYFGPRFEMYRTPSQGLYRDGQPEDMDMEDDDGEMGSSHAHR